MSVNLQKCTQSCRECVKKYIVKHQLRKGDTFDPKCSGIPLEYVTPQMVSMLGADKESALTMLDPVSWANKFLDWHCLDPDGAIWKRKTGEGLLPQGALEYNEEMAKKGLSPFHRPYQAEMVRCSSRFKVFRIGRQAGKSEAICISILYNIFTHENFSVVVVAPQVNHIELIFRRLNQLLNSSTTMSNSVARNVKGPNHTIELQNGSRVAGFTAGTKSGHGAGGVRGQTAHMLVFDEADMLADADVDNTLAVITNNPTATVWMSSTPTGRRDRFYKICQNRKYREFHYPSQVNPNFTQESDDFYKSQFTQDGYKHEVLAEFGEQEEGVYQLKYIEAAQTDYTYESCHPRPSWVYSIGVDWNDVKIGTTIAVVGFNPANGRFSLVGKTIVSKQDGTQLAACEEIAKLNRLWHPSFIYVDEGYGATQIEVLHEYGARALAKQGVGSPDARLRDIVRPYNFGGSIEIYDVWTKQPVKKPSKPFMVENSVRRFEQLQFQYPKSDEQFTRQLLGYVVDRISITGRPVYETRDAETGDHFLDAVNLALVGFAIEKGTFSRPTYLSDLAFGGRFGELPNPGNKRENMAEDHRPAIGRASLMQPENRGIANQSGELPAANNYVESSVKLWNWPGFEYDKPKPKVLTTREMFANARDKMFGSRSRIRPKRSKF